MHKLSYQPGLSFLHRLYPLTKFFWLILASVLIFIIGDVIILWATAGLSLVLLFVIFHDIWFVRGFRLALVTSSMLLILYLLFEKSGNILISSNYPILRVTTEGLETGLRVSSRYLSIIVLSYIFILSTDPNHLAYAFMELGLPYRFGFMLVTALRLVPILEQEGVTIYRAQLVRGIEYDHKGLRKIFLFMQQFLTPLIFVTLKRVDHLVFSMEGRGFGQFQTRTFRTRTKPTHLDTLVNLGNLLYFSVALLINFGGQN
jgi:energy-coupling factor transport system permease protein